MLFSVLVYLVIKSIRDFNIGIGFNNMEDFAARY